MSAKLLGLATAVPPFRFSQKALFDGLFNEWYAEIPGAEKIFFNTTVEHRHMSWDPYEAIKHGNPDMAARMKIWESSSLDMGRRMMTSLFEDIDKERIGTFVFTSCTGHSAPTPDMQLSSEFKLPPSVRRSFIGYMGCGAAFNAIRLGLDAVTARPNELALINVTETCSLQIHHEEDREQVVIHALFADAAASLVLGADDGQPGLRFLHSESEAVYETANMMCLHGTADGIHMRLSPYVPFILAEKVPRFVKRMANAAGIEPSDISHWMIHPGGPKIIDLVASGLSLGEPEVAVSRQVLRDYGNCAGTTILLVLDAMIKTEKPEPGSYGLMLAFGLGLTIEGAIVQF